MNILKSYKRSKLFTWVNITGLAIGLASSIILMLFIFNELSYDRHFENGDRIVNFSTVVDEDGDITYYSINLRTAYTEVPEKVAGVETAVQIYEEGSVEIKHELKRFQSRGMLYADPEFFKVFQMKFLEGTPNGALEGNNVAVITDKQAHAIFGDVSKAMGKAILLDDIEYSITGVVEAFPKNTHFTFDILVNMTSLGALKHMQGLEFHTYYLIKSGASISDVRASIEKENEVYFIPFLENTVNVKAHGQTQLLTDIYLSSKNDTPLGEANTVSFIWLLTALSLFILFFAITNFVNLFIAQGETRMNEIAIRKANGGSQLDLIRLFFSEISLIVFLSFVIAIVLALICAPYFSQLIGRSIDPTQMLDPLFVLCMIGLFVITVVLSALYPSFYLSKFSPLDILGKRIGLSKRKLTSVIVIFQSVITIVLLSYILIIHKQNNYLQSLPVGYNLENVVSFPTNNTLVENYRVLVQELSAYPEVSKVSGSSHRIGGGTSGEGISTLDNSSVSHSVNSYRVLSTLCDLMEFQLKEGAYFRQDILDSIPQIIINEAAVKILNLKEPVVGQYLGYKSKGGEMVVGVVKDFIYESPSAPVTPLVFSITKYPGYVYIRFNEGVSRTRVIEIISETVKKVDTECLITLLWEEDLYQSKFRNIEIQTKIILLGSLLSIFIASLGLVAIHLYTTMRREKEIAIRRINGATSKEMFFLLTKDVLKWIFIAAVIAMPIAYYISVDWLSNHAIRTDISWTIFAIPVVLQLLIAVLVTAGVSIKVLMQNPIESLKNE